MKQNLIMLIIVADVAEPHQVISQTCRMPASTIKGLKDSKNV